MTPAPGAPVANGPVRVLCGDVGGTKTLLALVDVDLAAGRAHVVREERVASRAFTGLPEAVRGFYDGSAARACFAVAGPVVDGVVRTTNLPWVVDRRALRRACGVKRLELINDFVAIGHGLPWLTPDDRLEIQAGEPDPKGPIAVLGAGTGLGVCYLTWAGRRYRVHGTEGGHVDFAPQGELAEGLLHYLRTRHGRVSLERVVSGPGLVAAHEYLVATGKEPACAEVTHAAGSGDAAAVISRHALDGGDGACVRALDLFVRAYGGAAGNLALTYLPSGGLYVAGGVAVHLVPLLRDPDGPFLAAFRDKGRLQGLVERIPVHLVLTPRVGLLGAAAVAAGAA